MNVYCVTKNCQRMLLNLFTYAQNLVWAIWDSATDGSSSHRLDKILNWKCTNKLHLGETFSFVLPHTGLSIGVVYSNHPNLYVSNCLVRFGSLSWKEIIAQWNSRFCKHKTIHPKAVSFERFSSAALIVITYSGLV